MGEESVWQGDLEVFSDDEEQRVIFSVLDSFRQYRRVAHHNVTHVRRQRFYALPTAQWTKLSKPPFSLLETLIQVDNAIDVNAELAEAIYSMAVSSMGLQVGPEESEGSQKWIGSASKVDLDKARSTLHQLFRDWSSEGAPERAACFEPIFRDLSDTFGAVEGLGEQAAQILVPGAGLGRLVFELCKRGFHVEGNEISYHQLFTSSFILNNIQQSDEWALHPFITSFSNNLKREDQMRKVMIPDENPGDTPLLGSMSMCAGDFCVVYHSDGYKGRYDAVVTLFFIDTAPNLFKYIETIHNCLKTGGVWINVGPLLWHYDGQNPESKEMNNSPKPADQAENLGIGEPGSFELSHDEVTKLVENLGFDIIKDCPNEIETGYIQNRRSMLRSTYKPVHWVARKV